MAKPMFKAANLFDKAKELAPLDRLGDEHFVLTLANIALFADAILGRAFATNLLGITYAWGEKLPLGSFPVAVIAYGALISFAAPLTRRWALGLTTRIFRDKGSRTFIEGRNAISGAELSRLGLLLGNSGLSAEANRIQDDWQKMNRFRDNSLVFGVLVLICLWLIPKSLIASLAAAAPTMGPTGGHVVLTVAGLAATLYGLKFPPLRYLHAHLPEADQQRLKDAVNQLPAPQ